MKYSMYKDNSNQWRWRLIASNGRIIADSGEAYTTKQACFDGITLVKSSSNAPVYEPTS